MYPEKEKKIKNRKKSEKKDSEFFRPFWSDPNYGRWFQEKDCCLGLEQPPTTNQYSPKER